MSRKKSATLLTDARGDRLKIQAVKDHTKAGKILAGFIRECFMMDRGASDGQ